MRVAATAARSADDVATEALDTRPTGGTAARGGAAVAVRHAAAGRDRAPTRCEPRSCNPLEGAAPGGRTAGLAAPCPRRGCSYLARRQWQHLLRLLQPGTGTAGFNTERW